MNLNSNNHARYVIRMLIKAKAPISEFDKINGLKTFGYDKSKFTV